MREQNDAKINTWPKLRRGTRRPLLEKISAERLACSRTLAATSILFYRVDTACSDLILCTSIAFLMFVFFDDQNQKPRPDIFSNMNS